MYKALKVLAVLVVSWSAGITLATLMNWPNFQQPHNWLAVIIFLGPGSWIMGRWAKGVRQRMDHWTTEELAKREAAQP